MFCVCVGGYDRPRKTSSTVTDKSTPTEGIRTMDPQFECPSALPTELIGKFPLATASRSTLYQHCFILPLSNEAMSQRCGPWTVELLQVLTGL